MAELNAMSGNKRVVFWLGWLALVGLAAWLRWEIAGYEFFWLDELHTTWVVDGAWSDVAAKCKIGNQTPLFFWLVRLSHQWFGQTLSVELSMRLVSLVSSVLVVGLAGGLVWRWTRCLIGSWLPMLWLAAGDNFLWYGTEARPYALVQLLGLLHVCLFWKWVEMGSVRFVTQKATSDRQDSSKDAASDSASAKPLGLAAIFSGRVCVRICLSVFLGMLSAGLVYTHLTSVSLFAAELVWWLGYRLCSRQNLGLVPTGKAFKNRTVLLGVAAVTFVALCFPLWGSGELVTSRKSNWSSISSAARFWQQSWHFIVMGLGLPLLVWAAIGFGAWYGKTSFNRSKIGFASLVLLWGVVPMLALVIASAVGLPMMLFRYAQVGVVAFPVFLGLAVANAPNRVWRWAGVLLAVGGMGYQSPFWQQSWEHNQLAVMRTEEWRSVSRLTHKVGGDKPVFLFGNVIEDVDALTDNRPEFQEYLCFPVHGAYPFRGPVLPRPTLSLVHFNESDIERIAKEGALLVTRSDSGLRQEIVAEAVCRVALLKGVDPDSIGVEYWNRRSTVGLVEVLPVQEK